MYVCTSSSLSIPLLMNRLRSYPGYCRYSCSEHWVACIFSNYGFFQIYFSRASLVAQLVKNPPAMQENQFDSWVWKIPWRRDILPTPVFLGFPGGSAGKKSTCKVRNLGLIPGLGRSPGGGQDNPLQYSCLENPHGQGSLVGYSSWGCKELDTTERLSTSYPSKGVM